MVPGTGQPRGKGRQTHVARKMCVWMALNQQWLCTGTSACPHVGVRSQHVRAAMGAPEIMPISSEGQSFRGMWAPRHVVGGIWWDFQQPLSGLSAWD